MELENMYPLAVRRMMPHIDEALDTYPGDLTEENLNRMSTHLVNRSGAMMDPPPSVNDFARWLLLARLAEESGVPFTPFFPFPFWYAPFPPFAPFSPSRPRRRR